MKINWEVKRPEEKRPATKRKPRHTISLNAWEAEQLTELLRVSTATNMSVMLLFDKINNALVAINRKAKRR